MFSLCLVCGVVGIIVLCQCLAGKPHFLVYCNAGEEVALSCMASISAQSGYLVNIILLVSMACMRMHCGAHVVALR